jgi:cytochrome c5
MLAALMTLSFGSLAMGQDVQERYEKSCIICHANGAAGAPKTGDVKAWEPRLAKGMEALVKSVEEGLKAMPPRGMCFDCSSEEYKALILLMAAPR